MKRLGATLSTVFLLALGSVVATPAAAQADRKIRVVQHNTDGVGYTSAVNAAAAWGDVDVMTFQEICRGEVDELRAAGYHVAFVPRVKHTHCARYAKKGRQKGIAVVGLGNRPLGKKKVVALGNYGDMRFSALCVPVKKTGVRGTTVCTTHLALGYGKGKDKNGKKNRARQMKQLARALNPMAKTRRMVVTGDFNMKPSARAFDRWYKVGGSGRWWEADQADKTACPTTRPCRNIVPTSDNGRQLDYAFSSTRGVNKLKGLSKGLVDSATAGHHIVRVQVTFN